MIFSFTSRYILNLHHILSFSREANLQVVVYPIGFGAPLPLGISEMATYALDPSVHKKR